MANHENAHKDPNQFVLSYELLLLLRWLIDHDEEKIKKMVTKAYRTGFYRELDKVDFSMKDQQQTEEMHESVIEFFSMLESLLVSTIHEGVRAKAQQQNLMPAIDKIDLNECDNETVQDCLEKATMKIEHNPSANPKELLFEELLRRWKPHNRNIVN